LIENPPGGGVLQAVVRQYRPSTAQGWRNPAVVIRFAIRGMAFANGPGIVACLPFPVNSHSHSHSLPLPWGGGVNHSSHDFPAKKQETEQMVRNGMEEQTARNKQAEAWGPALLVSTQNMGIPAHSSSVPVSAVGTAAAQ